MHLQNPKLIKEPQFMLFSAVGDGMHLELRTEPLGESVMSFREDEVLGKQAVLHLASQDIVISLVDLKRAIELAEIEVHCEAFYDATSPN